MFRCKKLLLVGLLGIGLIVGTVYLFLGFESGSNDSELWLRLQPPDLPVVQLGRLNVRADSITVSGFSAGASMATQLHMAHSSLFKGLAMFSQVFYRCGPESVLMFGLRCSKYFPQWFPYPVENALSDARNYEKMGLIDDLRNLQSHRVFVWIGDQDEYVPPALAKKNKEFYGNFMPEEQISLNVNPVAKHLLPTKSYGDACNADASKNVYLGNCNYSGPHHALQFLLGSDNVSENDGSYNESSLMLFDQQEFYHFGNITDAAMGAFGFVYVPSSCAYTNTPCHLHVNLHGCNEYPPTVALRYIRNSEFLPIAEKNRIIMLFPLTTKVAANIDGCWDFYSYTGTNFATKQGKQIQIIHGMVQRIIQGNLSKTQLLVD